MDDLDIVLLNVVSFMTGTLSGLALWYKWRIGCSNQPKESPPRDMPTMSHSSSGMFPTPPQEPVMASAPTHVETMKEIVIRT